jgi:nicotinamide-nucleotide amidase
MDGSDGVRVLAGEVLRACKARGLTVVIAESCTGGLVAATLTDIPGSSSVFERGFVTYSNAAKVDCLGVSMALIETHGAVSEPVSRAMAEGALARSPADLAVSITGIAGPGGGSADKPEGLVHFACARRISANTTATDHVRIEFGPLGRDSVRKAAVKQALTMLRATAQG